MRRHHPQNPDCGKLPKTKQSNFFNKETVRKKKKKTKSWKRKLLKRDITNHIGLFES